MAICRIGVARRRSRVSDGPSRAAVSVPVRRRAGGFPFGAAALAAGLAAFAPEAQADLYLRFFEKDGNVLVKGSGALEILDGSWTSAYGGSKENDDVTVWIDRTGSAVGQEQRRYVSLPGTLSGADNTQYDFDGSVSLSGRETWQGNAMPWTKITSGAEDNFHVGLQPLSDGKVRLVLDSSRIVGKSGDPDDKFYNLNGAEVAFAGTLAGTVGDDDFHVELTISSSGVAQRIVATTAQSSVPARPEFFAAEAGDREVRLSWLDPEDSGIKGYQLRYGAGTSVPADATWGNVAGSGANTAEHTVAGLANGTDYSFQIRAIDANGNGLASATATAKPVRLPDRPTGLTARAGDSRVVLSWSDPSDSTVTGYRFRKKEVAGKYGEWENAAGSGATTTSHDVTGLTNGTAYTFQIRAVSANGAGTVSAEVTTTPFGVPFAPTGLAATTAPNQVTLSWSDPSDTTVTRYEYRQRAGTGASSDWTNVQGSGASTTSFTVTGLENGITYTFWLRAVSESGNGPEARVEAALLLLPGKVTGLTAVAFADGVTLTWTNLDEYDIRKYQYKRKPVTEWSGIASTWQDWLPSGTETSSVAIRHGFAGIHDYVVRAVSSFGAGPESDPARVEYRVVRVSPTTLDVVENTGGTFTVSLASVPTADVTVSLSSDDANATLSPTSLTFTTENFSTAQTVTANADWSAWDGHATASLSVSGGGYAAAYAPSVRLMPVWETTPTLPNRPTLSVAPYETSVRLLYEDPTNVALSGRQYRYRVEGGDWGDWTDFSRTGTEDGSDYFDVTGLAAETAYGFQIRALRRGIAGPATSEAKGTTHARPDAPAGFAARPDEGEVILSWSDPGNEHVRGYEFRRTAFSGTSSSWGEWTKIAGSDASTTSHTVTGLTNGQSYSFQLRAFTQGQTGFESPQARATPNLRPGTVTYFVVQPVSGAVWLLFRQPANGDGQQYRFRVAGGTYGAWTDFAPVGSFPDGRSYFMVQNLENETAYGFQIRATNSGVLGPETGEATGTPHVRPAAPADFRAEADDGKAILLWSDPENVHIRIYQYRQRETSSSAWDDWTTIAGSDGKTTRHEVTGLTNGTSYTFKIRGFTQGQSSPESAEATATPDKVPARPTGFRLEPGNAAIKLVWNDQSDDPAGVAGWRYQQKVGSEDWGDWTDLPANGVVSNGETKTNEYSFGGLANGTVYGFSVRAATAIGTVGPSAPRSFATPGRPAGGSAVECGCGHPAGDPVLDPRRRLQHPQVAIPAARARKRRGRRRLGRLGRLGRRSEQRRGDSGVCRSGADRRRRARLPRPRGRTRRHGGGVERGDRDAGTGTVGGNGTAGVETRAGGGGAGFDRRRGGYDRATSRRGAGSGVVDAGRAPRGRLPRPRRRRPRCPAIGRVARPDPGCAVRATGSGERAAIRRTGSTGRLSFCAARSPCRSPVRMRAVGTGPCGAGATSAVSRAERAATAGTAGSGRSGWARMRG